MPGNITNLHLQPLQLQKVKGVRKWHTIIYIYLACCCQISDLLSKRADIMHSITNIELHSLNFNFVGKTSIFKTLQQKDYSRSQPYDTTLQNGKEIRMLQLDYERKMANLSCDHIFDISSLFNITVSFRLHSSVDDKGTFQILCNSHKWILSFQKSTTK